jgi:excisionase family DNA binding protein
MLRPKRLAEELDVTPGLIYRAIRSGDLAAVRLGSSGSLRIPRKAVDDWLTPTGKSRA